VADHPEHTPRKAQNSMVAYHPAHIHRKAQHSKLAEHSADATMQAAIPTA